MKSKKVSPLIAFKVARGFSILVTHRPVINAKLVLCPIRCTSSAKLKDTSFEGKGDYRADRKNIDRHRCSLEEMSIDVCFE